MTALEACQLLPCPFCGGEAHYSEFISNPGHTMHEVYCCAEIDGYDKKYVIKQWNTRAPVASVAPNDAWQPAHVEMSKGLTTNPDAKAWAAYFVQVFPGHKHMEDLMHSWFANAMMAMHDYLGNKTTPQAQPEYIHEGRGLNCGWCGQRFSETEHGKFCVNIKCTKSPVYKPDVGVQGDASDAEFLWGLLDDIDTASDMAKGDDKAYRQIVERIQKRRFEISNSDGYAVTFKFKKPDTEAVSEALEWFNEIIEIHPDLGGLAVCEEDKPHIATIRSRLTKPDTELLLIKELQDVLQKLYGGFRNKCTYSFQGEIDDVLNKAKYATRSLAHSKGEG